MKKRIIILGVIILTIVLAWCIAWYFISGQIRQQVEALALNDGETAPQLTCESLDISGFPFRFELDCKNVAIVSGDLLIEFPDLRGGVMAYRPNHVLASATGPAQISDAFTGLRQQVSWTDIEASLRVENWRIARVSIIGNDFNWTDTLFADTLITKSAHAEFHLLDIEELHDATTGRSALALFTRADDIEAPGIELNPTQIEIEAELTGLPDDIRNWGAVPFLPDWQQAGGELRLTGIRANDGTADLNATGQLQLDAQGYPTGTIDIDSLGVAQRVGALIEEPWRTLVLGVPGENGRHTNKLTLAGGGISSGLVPLAALPPLF